MTKEKKHIPKRIWLTEEDLQKAYQRVFFNQDKQIKFLENEADSANFRIENPEKREFEEVTDTSQDIITTKDKFEKAIEKWLGTKTKQQQRIWKLYNAENRKTFHNKKQIAKKLNKDDKYIRVTIKNLENSFLKEIPPVLKKK